MKKVILFSGGLDSTATLITALDSYDPEDLICLIFDYGQKNTKEIEAARLLADHFNIELQRIEIDVLKNLSDSLLLSDKKMLADQEHTHAEGQNSSFVPNRNSIFLTVAHAFAQKNNADEIWTGYMNDGYPDCRENFMLTLNAALNIGSEKQIKFIAPFMFKTKEDVIKVYENEDTTLFGKTYTCYNNSSAEHEWGRGCGECKSCVKRKESWVNVWEEFTYGR